MGLNRILLVTFVLAAILPSAIGSEDSTGRVRSVSLNVKCDLRQEVGLKGLREEDLRKDVVRRLTKAGIKVFGAKDQNRPANTPCLSVNVIAAPVDGTANIVAHIEVKKTELARLLRDSRHIVSAVSWKRAALGVYQDRAARDGIVRGVGSYIDEFIKECMTATAIPE